MTTDQPKAEPVEELVLQLTDLKFHEQDGVRRPSARARLVYEPATPAKREVQTPQTWRFIAPIGPIEAEELRWYLEKYAVWPSEYFRPRARKVEESLVQWGQLLYDAALPVAVRTQIDREAVGRFSVEVHATADHAARECATLLLGLPWELLHDGDTFLFHGAKPVRVRRRIPNERVLDVTAVETPIRILLITARPEDRACSYIDHRASALPLVSAMEALGGRVEIHVLDPPTLPALREELDRARGASTPYHVVHFDGHGFYDRRAGLGALCFEDPRDIGRLERRRHVAVNMKDLAPLLTGHGVPLVFLEACQTAHAEKASESVASELLKAGVASVVAMSHSVLVETSRRFVEAFYDSLAGGASVGDAMLRGQRFLKDDPFRGRVFGAGDFQAQDWFVPVLFQGKNDPQLFRTEPRQAQGDDQTARAARLGEVPAEPELGFAGRSRELLALQRLLRAGGARYAVIRGQGGEGKTALAAEFARWMVRSGQIGRAVFVSLETHSTAIAVLDAIGRQLVPKYSVATFKDLDHAILPVGNALAGQSTLLVVDNVESILLPPYVEMPEALSEDAREELDAILGLCARLNAKGETRLVFTSRERLPAPFHGDLNRRELRQLGREDAVKLVERALNEGDAGAGAAVGASREDIEQLVDSVHGHARTLSLLAPSLRSRGVDATRASLIELMAEMERTFPGNRERSLFASVELSLRRMSPENRERARVLGVFHGGVSLTVLRIMMDWEAADADSLAGELIETGLATPRSYRHLSLDPALCPWLRGQADFAEHEAVTARWAAAMRGYTTYLRQQWTQRIEVAATLTPLELPNLFALLDHVERVGDAEETINLATSLYILLQMLGKPRLLERVTKARDAAAVDLGEAWNHAQFQTQQTRIAQHLDAGRLPEVFDGAQKLLGRVHQAGEAAYPNADYDLAMGCYLLGDVLTAAGRSEQAEPFLNEALERFTRIPEERVGNAAQRMASACHKRRGDCLRGVGRLDEAAAAYENSIRLAEKAEAERAIAVAIGQLGTVRLMQGRYEEALQAHEETRERFTRLGEPRSVAASWHQIGCIYKDAGEPEAAEDAFREALALKVTLGDVPGQARTLLLLGNLYDDDLGRPEEAVTLYRKAADKYVELGDEAGEAGARSNLGETLRRLGRFDEARQAILRAIECKTPFGHAAEPWLSWAILAEIETADGNHVGAAEAKRRAVDAYLAYRRDGGENHHPDGRVCLAATQTLLDGDAAAVTAPLQRIAANDDLSLKLQALLQTLQAIAAGSRDRTLADNPDLYYTSAAEILFLLETLEKATPTPT